jgi:hypothetical protein
VFASPGPIYEPEGTATDYWRMARAIFAAGFRAGDLIHNSFSYHFVPAGSMMETGAHALGCTVFPGGTGQTEQQVQAMAELKPAGYIGTPSFLKIILEKAAEMGVVLPSVTKAMFGVRQLQRQRRQQSGLALGRVTRFQRVKKIGHIPFLQMSINALEVLQSKKYRGTGFAGPLVLPPARGKAATRSGQAGGCAQHLQASHRLRRL